MPFSHFMKSPEILDKAQLISVDRPGYGKSGFGEWETSLLAQVKLIQKTFKHAQVNQPIVVAGHSYGAPVAARLAMEYPDEVAGLVMVAASIDPYLERHQWYQKAAKSWFIRWALPKDLRVANEEIWPLKNELQSQDPFVEMKIKCR
jgi:pimeloyl-ACP methyl ester carboxylesterase